MVRVGLVDIDTTHPWILGNYVNQSKRAKVVAITDAGTVWPPEHLQRLAACLNAEVVEDVREMVERVDAALFLGVRYDLRLDRALPMIEAGKSVFLDKAAVGNMDEVQRLKRFLDSGARIMCGSSLPFCKELTAFAEMIGSGHPANLAVIGCQDFFEHGLHAADIALSIAQAAPRRVKWSAFGPCEIVWAELENGMPIVLFLESPGSTWSVMGMNYERTFIKSLDLSVYQDCHYARLVNAFLEMQRSGQVAVSPYIHLESVRLLIAAKRSREEGRTVTLDELRESDGFDGREYAESYRAIARQRNSEDYLLPDVKVLMRKKPRITSAGLRSYLRQIAYGAIHKAKTITKRIP